MMNERAAIRSILENFLFLWLGVNLVLAIAGSAIVLPDWLLVLGRTHPLLLHFPIVLLLMGLLFFWIPDLQRKPDLRQLGELCLLLGANFAGFTVLAGLILASEDYDSGLLVWHQWAGIGVFFLSVLLYFFRNTKVLYLKSFSLILALGIVLTGHWGATLTHGEDFLLAPILEEEPTETLLSEAVVFDDLVMPILESKCVSCHKESKTKGKLRLDHEGEIIKGGKSGDLLIAGDLENSLLIQRILLPKEEKKHMPPKNKPQLTAEELALLKEWVASGASFEQKVKDSAPDSELFRLASNRFQENQVYSFSPADPDVVANLNNYFRIVQPIFPESPALEAAYFGISAFDPESLRDLLKVKDQLVQLNLNKMPLEGIDLSFLGEFQRLEDLQLNFTGLSSEQLKQVSQVKSLKKLAISGNELREEDLETLIQMDQLKSLYLWQTGLSNTQKQTLEDAFPKTKLHFGFDGANVIYPLNAPKIEADQILFEDSLIVRISHPIPSAEIRFTTDGSEPDSTASEVYSSPIAVRNSGELKARAFAKDWIGSPETKALLIKSGHKPLSYQLKTSPGENYAGKDAETLFDGVKGKNNHTSGEWLGYQDSALELEIEPAKEVIQEMVISMLFHEGAYIFPPARIELSGMIDGKWEQISSEKPAQSTEIKEVRPSIVSISFEDKIYEKLLLKVIPISKLPAWHPGAGSKGWVFVDEIVLN